MIKTGKLFVLLSLVCFMAFSVMAYPSGADATNVANYTLPEDAAGSHEAIAGNVSLINIFGYTTTRSWQGFYGNVSGVIHLGDADRNIMYNWTVASPRGQVYASTNNTVTWPNVQCFNFSAAGTYADDTANAGETSLFGTNLTILQEEFGVEARADDSVNNTFHYIGPADGHALFHVGPLEFTEGQCQTARIFGPGGTQVKGEFEQTILYEPDTRSIIWTSILEEDRIGFDGVTHDFQMLVLEDGQGTNVDTTTYFFWVEIF